MNIKKLFLVPVLAVMLFFGLALNAEAYIGNEYELNQAIQKLEELLAFDSTSLINKAELIGNRRGEFDMARMTYNSSVSHAIERLKKTKDDIYKFSNMQELNASEREIQIQRLYQEANTIVSDLNNQTSTFLYNVKAPMPTITYERFKEKFTQYYYSLGL